MTSAEQQGMYKETARSTLQKIHGLDNGLAFVGNGPAARPDNARHTNKMHAEGHVFRPLHDCELLLRVSYSSRIGLACAIDPPCPIVPALQPSLWGPVQARQCICSCPGGLQQALYSGLLQAQW